MGAVHRGDAAVRKLGPGACRGLAGVPLTGSCPCPSPPPRMLRGARPCPGARPALRACRGCPRDAPACARWPQPCAPPFPPPHPHSRAAALRHMGVGLVVGTVFASIWGVYAHNSHKEWAVWKKVRGRVCPLRFLSPTSSNQRALTLLLRVHPSPSPPPPPRRPCRSLRPSARRGRRRTRCGSPRSPTTTRSRRVAPRPCARAQPGCGGRGQWAAAALE
jgi:hypothetical protein